MNFVKSNGNSSLSGSSVNWTNNPIYQSPENAGVSWYDQATHWDPASEGIHSIAQNSTNDPIPYWASHESNIASVRQLYNSPIKTNTTGLGYTPQITSVAETSAGITPSGAAELAAAAGRESSVAASKTAAEVSGGVATGVQAIEGVASAFPGPGTALLINSIAGDATASAINASDKNTIASDFLQNSKQQGSQSGYQANLIRQMEEARSNANLAGGRIGGIFGPLGAFFGHMLASAFQDTNPNSVYDDYKTSYSFEGKYNPQDTGAVNSGTTANLTGETNMIQNV